MDVDLFAQYQPILIPRPGEAADAPAEHLDLKRNPERISGLSELRGFTEAQELVRAVNGGESRLRTVGPLRVYCEVTTPPTNRCVSYVGVAYEDAVLACAGRK